MSGALRRRAGRLELVPGRHREGRTFPAHGFDPHAGDNARESW